MNNSLEIMTPQGRTSDGRLICHECGHTITEGELFIRRGWEDRHVSCDKGDGLNIFIVVCLVFSVLGILALALAG